MAFFTWTENMSVGVEEFDTHHKKLVDLTNQLFDAMSEGKGRQVVGGVLEELLRYSEYHFSAEEKKMKEMGYPAYPGHQAEHQKFVEEATTLYRKFQGGDIFISLDTLNFLKDWLSKHILQTDMAYKPFFNNKGIR
ncbi:bacteriohemerythrin [Thermospira aquatica]|uniref:Hemerythrin family protein n=1 Tax=Thermospira aquatica TaxID=2828656 RepID=A0AAX3BBI3_9SPIR|nr:bacteriohemerythrin [Thermospira aquatica]URA09627.1 hemerythrin family protein [Thermospira aquatica]